MGYAFPEHDRYEPLEVLGQGGMGVVFRAFDRHLQRDIALKIMRRPEWDGVDQLKAEFRARSEVHHPNLLALLDLEVTRDHAFFTMDVVSGVDLASWFRSEQPLELVSTLGLGDTLGAVAAEAMGTAARTSVSLERLSGLVTLVCQLIGALDALHRSGLVHRDVKPQNVLVDEDGRALLADFGLTTSFRTLPGKAPSREIAGTPGFMAPELLRGERATPASDAYALGATLFYLLAGRLPRFGEPVKDALPSETPDVWRQVIGGLTHPESKARMRLEECHACLRSGCDEPPLPLGARAMFRGGDDDLFVGRARELTRLRAWAMEARTAATTTVAHVIGLSGMGKTKLVEALLGRVEETDLLVLRGRCHPREHVAFGGFDTVVEDAVAWLAVERSDLDLPPHEAFALARVFPTFQRLMAAPSPSGTSADASARRRAFSGLRRIIERISRRQPVLLWLEDLHWIEPDAVELLDALLRDGGPGQLLVVLTYRPVEAAQSAAADALELLERHDGRERMLNLGPLSAEEAATMLARLGGSAIPAHIVDATLGHPILVREVARHVTAGEPLGAREELSLAHLINASVTRLEPVESSLLDLLVVSPWPVPTSVALRALPPETKPSVVVGLQQTGFVRLVGGRAEQTVAPYHDQIRFVRSEVLSEERRRSLHAALAASYEATDRAAHEQLAHHHHAAGDLPRAGTAARRAAERAAEQLAFRKAASFYEQALRWLPDGARDSGLHARLGDMRSMAGLATDAGDAFERAARLDEGRISARLLTRAAEQFLHGGWVLDGYRLLRESFAQFGVELPRSNRQALVMSLGLRARLIAADPFAHDDAVAGHRDGALEQKLDALWTATNGLIHINHALADVMLLLHTLEARRLDDDSRLVRSLTLEAGAEATLGGRVFNWRARRLLAQAERILERSPSPFDRGWLAVGRGAVACFQGDWRASAHWGKRAYEVLADPALGASFERSVNSIYHLTALAHLGRLEELALHQARAQDDARERGDDFALNIARSGHAALVWLARDELDVARAEAEALFQVDRIASDGATARPWPEGTFRTPDYHNLVATTHLALYEGAPQQAYARLRHHWERIADAMLLRVKFVGADLLYLRAKVALATMRSAGGRGRWSRRELSADARRMARALARDGHPLAEASALTVRAALRSTDPGAAARAFDALGMRLHAASLRRQAGSRDADGELRAWGVEPERFA